MYQIRMISFNTLPEVVPEKQEPEHEFDLGDAVIWDSCGTTKRGIIVAIVPANESPPVLEEFPEYSFKANGCGSPRKSISYLIAVSLPRCRVKKLYWPVVKVLRKL